jgi:phosphoribosylformylglycinamidine synthase
LTNKVDRSVTGKVATQQTVGEIQLPLNNLSVMALDFKQLKGVATSIGHAPVSALIHPGAGSRLSVAEALTNLVFAPLTHGIQGISLSANWMWPAKNPGENYRLYEAVKQLSDFCCELGINIPTGKDSLSMTQKYPGGKKVMSPGTVIISSVAEVTDIRKTITPELKTTHPNSKIAWIDFSGDHFELGGTSFAQVLGQIGEATTDVEFKSLRNAFETIQVLVKDGKILAGHDVSAGGLITTLLEMNFPNTNSGMLVDLDQMNVSDPVKILFSERPAIVIQYNDPSVEQLLKDNGVNYVVLGKINTSGTVEINHNKSRLTFSIEEYRDIWMESSHALDRQQSRVDLADARFENYKTQPLEYRFPEPFDGYLASFGINPNRKAPSGVRAAIIREKGVNGDREMAYSLWLAGFDVKDVHMTDLVHGRETLDDINMIVFVGGFSNSDVLGSAKGWAGSFLFNENAKETLDRFYNRPDTLSLGVCNGCQVMMELEKIYPEMEKHPKMAHNDSGKFESSFVNVDILPNDTVMFGSLSGSRLGIWVAHGEGKFVLNEPESNYSIPVKYSYSAFPGNPNGSSFSTAALASKNGRHVAIMPHLERSIFPWNWAHHQGKFEHEVTPWVVPFINARKWVEQMTHHS